MVCWSAWAGAAAMVPASAATMAATTERRVKREMDMSTIMVSAKAFRSPETLTGALGAGCRVMRMLHLGLRVSDLERRDPPGMTAADLA